MAVHILTAICLCMHTICFVAASMSGFFVDNGQAQTIMHRMLTPSDTEKVEHEILELLGLPDRPSRNRHHPSMQKSAPKFLLDVYKQLNGKNDDHEAKRYKRETKNEPNAFIDVDQELIEESDIIMTFLSKKNHIAKVRHERGRKLWFDMTEVDRNAVLMMAKLRIYQNSTQGHDGQVVCVTAYAIIRSGGEYELMRLSSINTTSDHRGWLELVVSAGLSMWLSDDRQNKGLFISVVNEQNGAQLDEVALVNAKGDDEHQPFLVGFFKGPNLVHMDGGTRGKRNAPARHRKSVLLNPLLANKSQLEIVKSCQIQTLYISFKDLKWQDWIIAPDGYGAFFCSGECNFPLNTHMNATNHAIVQTLVHLQNPSRVPKPCCAPIKLSPISVLFFLDESHVNLKKYKNMVVNSCGCH